MGGRVEKLNKEGVLSKIFEVAEEIIKERKRPLLLMFYSDRAGKIVPPDVTILQTLFEEFYNGEKDEELDLIIYTRGGDVNTSYLLAQLIRSHTQTLFTLVPYYAYSGGTVISLSSDLIEMGTNSKISPIDVQIGSQDQEDMISLLSIEKYIEFMEHCCTNVFKINDEKCKTEFAVGLTKELVKNFHPVELGDIFRLQNLSKYYARILLIDYMFKNVSERRRIAEEIIKRLSTESPSHAFDIDIHIAQGIGLKVESMNQKIYKLSRLLIDYCTKAKQEGLICHYHARENNLRKPFFFIFGKKRGEQK